MSMMLKQIATRVAFMSFICLFSLAAYADDAQSAIESEKGRKAFIAGDFRAAAKAYEAAELYADTPDLKLEAIQKAAESFGKAGLKYKQFLCLKKQISGFADKIDYGKTVEAEYAIGNEFLRGHRDVTLSWLPWIKERNRAVTIYETILKQVPFAKFAPMLQLRLGRMYIENGEYKKSLKVLRTLIRKHPKTEAAKYGRFELANALVQLAGKAGDGDGAYAREAEDLLKESLKLYPDDPETQWLKESQDDTDAVRAERLYNLAEFYESRDNNEAAIRYFHDLLSRFPDSAYSKKAEKHLVNLDDNYKPRKVKKKKAVNPYPSVSIPNERGVILVAPEASGGKWMLPIEDLDLDGKHAENEYQARKKALAAKRKRDAERLARIKARREAARKRLEAKRKKEAIEKAKADAEAKAKAEKRRAIEKEKALKAKKVADAKLKQIRIKAERDAKKAEKIKAENQKKAAAKLAKAKKDAAEKERRLQEAAKKKKEAEKKAKASAPSKKTSLADSASAKDKKGSSWSFNYFDAILAILLLLIAGIVISMRKRKKAQS